MTNNSLKTPGPGSYNTSTRATPGVGFTFQFKNQRYPVKDTPGPGTYNIITEKTRIPGSVMTPLRPATAKERSPGPAAYLNTVISVKKAAPAFTMSKADNLSQSFQNPGPTDYSPVKSGTTSSTRIGRQQRDVLFCRNENPGPGAYSTPKQ
jgi:hypothetical protein